MVDQPGSNWALDSGGRRAIQERHFHRSDKGFGKAPPTFRLVDHFRSVQTGGSGRLTAPAMTLIQYDKMSDDGQNEYIADLVVGAMKVLSNAVMPIKRCRSARFLPRLNPVTKRM